MDHSQSKISEYLGKTCPYCKTEFREGDEIVVCSACEMPHHKDCWIENQGCTTFGCQGTIRGIDGQAYGQMMAAGARPSAAPHYTPSSAGYAPGDGTPFNSYGAGYAPNSGAQPNAYGASDAPGGGAPVNPYRGAYAPTAGSAGASQPCRAAGAAQGPYCSWCGTRNTADAKFCYECGAELFLAPAPKNEPPRPSVDASRPYDAIPKQGGASVSRPYDSIPKQGGASVSQPYDAIPKQGGASVSQPYDAIPKQGGASASRPYDVIPKQGAPRPQPSSPYRAASPSASPNPYHAPQPAAAPAQPANSYRPAQPPGYPPPGAAYPGAYRQAGYPPPGAAAPLTPEEFAQEQKLFLQENEAYYQKQFAAIKSGQFVWNWSACLLGPFWLLYRRMYAWGYSILFGQFMLFGMMGYAWPVVPLLVAVMLGIFGTRIYLGRVEQEMNRVRRLSALNRRIEYADRGGVRIGQALAMAAVFALLFSGILSAIYY